MKKDGVFEWMRNRANEGTDQNMIPEGIGEFGFDMTNPIPTHTISGTQDYLDRLYTNKGVKIKYERLGSTIAPNIKNVIDVYLISTVDNEKELTELVEIYISPYHKKTSEKAPEGFKLLSSVIPKTFYN